MFTRILIRYYRGSAALVNRISPDIKDAAFCTGIKVNNNTDTWRGMLNVYMTTKSASEKNSAQTALTCSQDTLVLYKYVYNCRNSRYFQLARVLGVGDGLFFNPCSFSGTWTYYSTAWTAVRYACKTSKTYATRCPRRRKGSKR